MKFIYLSIFGVTDAKVNCHISCESSKKDRHLVSQSTIRHGEKRSLDRIDKKIKQIEYYLGIEEYNEKIHFQSPIQVNNKAVIIENKKIMVDYSHFRAQRLEDSKLRREVRIADVLKKKEQLDVEHFKHMSGLIKRKETEHRRKKEAQMASMVISLRTVMQKRWLNILALINYFRFANKKLDEFRLKKIGNLILQNAAKKIQRWTRKKFMFEDTVRIRRKRFREMLIAIKPACVFQKKIMMKSKKIVASILREFKTKRHLSLSLSRFLTKVKLITTRWEKYKKFKESLISLLIEYWNIYEKELLTGLKHKITHSEYDRINVLQDTMSRLEKVKLLTTYLRSVEKKRREQNKESAMDSGDESLVKKKGVVNNILNKLQSNISATTMRKQMKFKKELRAKAKANQSNEANQPRKINIPRTSSMKNLLFTIQGTSDINAERLFSLYQKENLVPVILESWNIDYNEVKAFIH